MGQLIQDSNYLIGAFGFVDVEYIYILCGHDAVYCRFI